MYFSVYTYSSVFHIFILVKFADRRPYIRLMTNDWKENRVEIVSFNAMNRLSRAEQKFHIFSYIVSIYWVYWCRPRKLYVLDLMEYYLLEYFIRLYFIRESSLRKKMSH